MKITVLRKNLSQALSIASRAVSNQADLAILGNLLIKAYKNQLTISATDLEIGVTIKVTGKVDKTGEITVPAQIFTEFVNNSPSKRIEISTDEDTLKLESKKSQAQIKGQSTEEFPKIPDIEEEKTKTINIPSAKLLKGLNRVLVAPAQDDSRPVLAGVFFDPAGKLMKLAGTDSYRLSEEKISLEEEVDTDPFIIPVKACQELTRITEKEAVDNVQILVSENQVGFKTQDTLLVTRLVEGDYPDYEQIIPEQFQTKVKVDREELMNAAKTAWLFSRDQANNIQLKVTSDEEIKIIATSPQIGKSESTIELDKMTGPKVNISFNVKFINDILSVLEEEKITLGFNDPVEPAQIKAEGLDNFLYIIMPLKQEE